jgi:DNA-binding HxlR family transcriptional regulator
VRGSASGRPLLAAFDLLGRRWALRVVWELRDGPVGARELRSRCDDVSPSVLYDRLRELVEAGLVERDDRRYRLSELGAELEGALRPLGAWADRWAEGTTPDAS